MHQRGRTRRPRRRIGGVYVCTLLYGLTAVDAFAQSAQSSGRSSHQIDQNTCPCEQQNENGYCTPNSDNRRALMKSVMAGLSIAIIPQDALGALPEIDDSGELFSPKSIMLRGGSDDTRGMPLRQSRPSSSTLLKPGQALQTVYETRFLTYLSRFLLTFDPAARSWWVKQGLDDTWESDENYGKSEQERYREQEKRFAAFAESVEVGLADYFVGPYGSYASVQAAKAGLSASQPQESARDQAPNVLQRIFLGTKVTKGVLNSASLAKQGVLNLYALLKARYVSEGAKRQLAILFSLITSPDLQPTGEITSLLGEADNATVAEVEMQDLSRVKDEAKSRTSPRRGGGYSIHSPPAVTIDDPPALGDQYNRAKVQPVLQSTSRLLKINVIDGGDGYMRPPNVIITQGDVQRTAKACAIVNREGRVESVVLLDPGFGYGGRGRRGTVPPSVSIEPPIPREVRSKEDRKAVRRARAEAELEYEIVAVDVIEGGNGYSASNPPKIFISPPEEDPDWYLPERNTDLQKWGYGFEEELQPVLASVTVLRVKDGNLVSDRTKWRVLDYGILERVRREPLELLPSSIRPQLKTVDDGRGVYYIPSLPSIGATPPPPSATYRAFDPIFGGVGSAPVTKGALALSASEYTRLALSGAICTVLVRNALSPLELVKTKLQLKNDKELMDFVSRRTRTDKDPNHLQTQLVSSQPRSTTSLSTKQKDLSVSTLDETQLEGQNTMTALMEDHDSTGNEAIEVSTDDSIGTVDMLRGLIQLRGVGTLFQSADITFLASLVFGSLGFGATELFRRSFTIGFFTEDGGGEEIILLAAAALACVVSAAVASPFEVLRVKSMGLLEPIPAKDVLHEFLDEKGATPGQYKLYDYLPLWGGFAPTVSRELPFAIIKFLTFDVLAKTITSFVNSNLLDEGAIPIEVGVGTEGLIVSAISGAVAGVTGAIVSHPADLILTLTSSSSSSSSTSLEERKDWRDIVADLLSRKGGIANLFIGLPARSIFFFLVIGLQFFLYDYVKSIFQVGSDDLSLVLDVFYAIRQGLADVVATD